LTRELELPHQAGLCIARGGLNAALECLSRGITLTVLEQRNTATALQEPNTIKAIGGDETRVSFREQLLEKIADNGGERQFSKR
jgi:hypothetical protein